MLNNPDIQPNNAMNRWIASILLFDFDLVHVLGPQHRGPDGLSRRCVVGGEDEQDDDDWVERALELGVWVTTWKEVGSLQGFGIGAMSRATHGMRELHLGRKVFGRSGIGRELLTGGMPGRMPEDLEGHIHQATLSFLSFSLFDHEVDDDLVDTSLPQNDQDRLVDAWMARIQDFLTSGHLDETARKKFLHHALRFFVKDGIL